ncbi:MAG: hypothetical protein U9N36_10095, partial [Euryarchaeota archaeon]|nr:hypothetical protein [Euryarchaeota archaeon]
EVTGTKTVIYDVTVPAGTTTGDYPVTGTVIATVGGSTIGPFDLTGANQVTVTECACDFCLDLEAGLNFVSIPKTLDDPKNATTLFGVDYYSGECCLYYDASVGSFDLDADVKPCRGFLVYKTTEKRVCVDFDDTASPPSQQLYEGWNTIGYPRTVALSIPDFASVTGLKDDDGNKLFRLMATYTGTGWIDYPVGSLTEATPGAGYWIYMNQNVEMSGGFE